jgi:hypothetical protein
MIKLIGLYSSAAQSGKSTVSRELELRGFVRVPFAEPLKLMVGALLVEVGRTPGEVRWLLHEDKEEVLEELGVSSRHLLQTLGTEWGRQCISPDVWLKVWRARASRYERVVVDDVRFENEAELLRSLGGDVWRVQREGVANLSTHASEGGLDAWPHFSRYITNNGTLGQLKDAIAAIPLGEDGADPPR